MPNAMDVFELIADAKPIRDMVLGLLKRARPLVASYTRAKTLRTFIEWAEKADPDAFAWSAETCLALVRLPSVRSAIEATQNDTAETGLAQREAILRGFAEALADAFLDVARPATQYGRECATGSEQRQWEDARKLQLLELDGVSPSPAS